LDKESGRDQIRRLMKRLEMRARKLSPPAFLKARGGQANEYLKVGLAARSEFYI
jgi:hypothetical protein